MIKAEEMRLGNKVLLNGSTYEYGALDFWEGTNEKCDPIPLTHEILEGCGFEKRENLFVLETDDGRLEFEGIDENGILQPYLYYTGANIDDKAKPKYLHQLQNLIYALTGEELTVKLPVAV